MNNENIIAVVEVGTEKTVALIADLASRNGGVDIIGRGISMTRGMVKGMVVHFDDACASLSAALQQAENKAGVDPGTVVIAYTGGQILTTINRATVPVRSASGEVTDLDVKRLNEEVRSSEPLDGYTILHYIAGMYHLDGQPMEEARGCRGRELGTSVIIMQTKSAAIENHIGLGNASGYPFKDIYFSGMASGHQLATDEDKKNGLLVIDMGAGTTDYVCYHQGLIKAAGCIPVGGQHLSNDLSVGLRTSMLNAEKLKRQHGRVPSRVEDKSKEIWLHGDHAVGDRSFPLYAVTRIMELRLEETFELVAKAVGPKFIREKLNCGIYLTGGCSQIPGICDLATKVFGVGVVQPPPPDWVIPELRGPEFTTILGLLQVAVFKNQMAVRRSPEQRGLIHKVKNIFSSRR